MGLNIYKRGSRGTYWLHQEVDGRKVRVSLRTTDWKVAQHRAAQRIKEMLTQQNSPPKADFAELQFTAAAEQYLAERKLELSPSSLKKERQLLRFSLEHFKKKTLSRVSLDDLLGYRSWRAAHGTGNSTLNMEMGVLRRILKRAKVWYRFEPDVRPLKEKHQFGRALTPDEKARLLEVAFERPEWFVARCAAIIALNSTLRGCELKGLRWADVDYTGKLLTVRRSKTDAGQRVVPINANAMAAFKELHQRAMAFSGAEPSHFVFPTCEHGQINPSEPMRSWRTAWRKLTAAAGLAGLRFHDLRHHCITELAESQTAEQTILSIAGHVSRRMLEHYSHVRIEAKRKALDGLV